MIHPTKASIARALGYSTLRECGPKIENMIRNGSIEVLTGTHIARINGQDYKIEERKYYKLKAK